MCGDIFKSMLNRKRLICFSLFLGITFSVCVSMYPIPFVVRLSLPNSEGFFSLMELKTIKIRLPNIINSIMVSEKDLSIKNFIAKYFNDPKWIDKNITATLALTKADIKDAIANPTGDIDNIHVEWVHIETVSSKEEIALRSAKMLSEIIFKTAFIDNLKTHLSNVREEKEVELLAIYDQLPALEKWIEQLQGNMQIIKQTFQKYPDITSEQLKFQLNFSADKTQDGVNKLNEFSPLTVYLSPQKQLSIYEIQIAQAAALKIRLKLEKEVIELVRNAANNQLIKLESISPNEISDQNNILYNLWENLDFENNPRQPPGLGA